MNIDYFLNCAALLLAREHSHIFWDFCFWFFFFLSVFVVNVHTIVIELLITWSHYDSELSLLHFFQASVNYRNLAIAAVSTFTLF